MKYLILTTVLIGLALASLPASADDRDDDTECFTTQVEALDFVEVGLTGKARLCIDDSGLTSRMRIKNLTGQNAYTVWWVYIDEPVCPGGGFFGCIFTFFGVDPLAVFGRMDSGISPANGKLGFSNKLDDMRVSAGSQVWLLTFGHGPASEDGRQLARQLLTPEDPTAGAPHLGVDPNGYPVSVAVFEIP